MRPTHDARRARDASAWKRVFRSPAFLLANVALLLIVGFSTMREAYHGWTVENEIRALDAQATELEGQKLAFLSLAQSLASPEHVELEARKLGWKKEGERVAVLTGFTSGTNAVNADADQILIVPSARGPFANLQAWWEYFFLNT